MRQYLTIKVEFFLILYLVVLFAFIMILYQRYSQVSINERKQIAILKTIGYSVRDIIKIKMSENFVVAFVSYLLGLISIFFVFILNAPILKNIFIDFQI